MLGFRSQWTWVLVLSAWVALGARASAQERLDSSVRAWADVDFYSGDLLFPGSTVTSVTPVLRGEVELSSLQLGLDLPLALGITSFDSVLLDGSSVERTGTGARFGNPTLHVDYVTEHKPTRAAIGLALAISTSDGDGSDSSTDDLAADAGAVAGLFSRGLWNSWWYLTSAWGLVVPMSVEHDTDEYEVGADAAFAWLLTRGNRDNLGILQLGGHAAGVFGPGVLGLRLNGVLALDDNFLGDDRFQLSTEPYFELRLPVVWLGAGINIPLDEPLGVFGDGGQFWALRISGGASF